MFIGISSLSGQFRFIWKATNFRSQQTIQTCNNHLHNLFKNWNSKIINNSSGYLLKSGMIPVTCSGPGTKLSLTWTLVVGVADWDTLLWLVWSCDSEEQIWKRERYVQLLSESFAVWCLIRAVLRSLELESRPSKDHSVKTAALRINTELKCE